MYAYKFPQKIKFLYKLGTLAASMPFVTPAFKNSGQNGQVW